MNKVNKSENKGNIRDGIQEFLSNKRLSSQFHEQHLTQKISLIHIHVKNSE